MTTRGLALERKALDELERGLRALVPGFYHRCPMCKAGRALHHKQTGYHTLITDEYAVERKCELTAGEREVLRLLAALDAAR